MADTDRFDQVFIEPSHGDARHRELAAQGVALFPPEATHWGTRWFVARDPDGKLIAFEQSSP